MGDMTPHSVGHFPQNCGTRAKLLTEDDDFWTAAELCDQAVAALRERCGTIGATITFLSRHYGLKPSWLQRLRERRPVPVPRSAYHNLVVALEEAIARKEAEIELQKARLQASRTTNAARDIGLPAGLGIAPASNSPALVE